MDGKHSFRVAVLGDLEINQTNDSPPTRPTLAARNILANLVAAHGRPVPAEILCEIDPQSTQSRAALRMALSRLRTQLPTGAIPDAKDSSYRLALPAKDVDLWTLLEYRLAPLPATLTVRDLLHLVTPADPFRNVHLSDLVRSAITEIEAAQRDLIDRVAVERPDLLPGALLEQLEAHRARDPFNERLLLVTVRSIASGGNRRRALQVLRDATDDFSEVGLSLSRAASALETELLDGDIEIAPLPDVPPETIRLPPRLAEVIDGNYIDVDGLADSLAAQIVGIRDHVQVWSIVAESGLGKTRTCAEVAIRIAASVRTIYAAPVAPEATVAFGPLLTAFPEFEQATSAMEVTTSSGSLDRAAVWTTFLRCLREAAQVKPVLFVVDDCEALDTQSTDLLANLVGAELPGVTMLLAAHPRQDLHSRAWLLDRIHPERRIELPRFDLRAMRQMVENFHPMLDERLLRHLASETLRASSGLPGIAAVLLPNAETSFGGLPDAAAVLPNMSVGAIIDQLSSEARTVGTAASIADAVVNIAYFEATTGLDDDRILIGAIDELVGAELLLEHSIDRFSIRHLLVQSAFLHSQLQTQCAHMHWLASKHFAEDLHRRARHQAKAGTWVDEAIAARSLLDSANLLLSEGLSHEAVRSYQLASVLINEIPLIDEVGRSRALDLTGNAGSAVRVRQGALERAIAMGDSVTALAIATSGLPEAEPIDGDPVLVENLLSVLEVEPRAEIAHRVECHLARQLTIVGRVGEAEQHAARALALSRTDLQRVQSAIAARFAVSTAAPPAERLSKLPSQQALAVCDEATQAEVAVLAAIDHYEDGDIESARERRRAFGDARLAPVRRWHACLFDGLLASDGARFDEAASFRQEAFDVSIAMGAEEGTRALFASTFVDMWLLGKLAELNDAVEASPVGRDDSVLSVAARGLISSHAGDSVAAFASAREVLDRVERNQMTQGTAAIAVVSEILAQEATAEERRRAAAHLEKRGDSMLIVGAFAASLGPIARHLGQLAATKEEKLQHFQQAKNLADRSGLLLWQVVSRRDLMIHAGVESTDMATLVGDNETLAAISGSHV